jgi:hypothetical protein
MDVREAILTVLRDADAPLHWTKVQDQALRAGYLDPFEHRDVRRLVQTELHALAREGAIVRAGKGVFAAQPDEDEEA